jgi:hypothetical protein
VTRRSCNRRRVSILLHALLVFDQSLTNTVTPQITQHAAPVVSTVTDRSMGSCLFLRCFHWSKFCCFSPPDQQQHDQQLQQLDPALAAGA